jgi:hypothetical protein
VLPRNCGDAKPTNRQIIRQIWHFGLSRWRCSKIRCIFQTGIRCIGQNGILGEFTHQTDCQREVSTIGNSYSKLDSEHRPQKWRQIRQSVSCDEAQRKTTSKRLVTVKQQKRRVQRGYNILGERRRDVDDMQSGPTACHC